MKKITISLFLVLMAPTLSWSMQRKQLSPKPTKSRLQAAKNRKNKLLLQAAQEGKLEQLSALASQADLNFHDPETDASPLMVACEKGQSKIVKFLVKKLTMKEINERRGMGAVSVTSLWLATHKGRTKCVRALVQAGALSVPDQEGYTPIHLAADGTDLNLLCCLLQANADMVDMQNIHGVTALHKAVYKNNVDAAALLLSYDACPEIQDANGLSAFDYATSDSMRELLERYAQKNNDMPPHYDQAAAQKADPAISRVAWVAMQPGQGPENTSEHYIYDNQNYANFMTLALLG